MISINSQGKDLLDSKSFLALGLGETIVSLGKGSETLRFILDFIEDKDKDKEQGIEWVVVNDKTLRIKLTNWSNTLGTTLTKPVEVGTFQHRKLFLILFVKKAGDKGQIRLVTFSAYLGEEVQDGAN